MRDVLSIGVLTVEDVVVAQNNHMPMMNTAHQMMGGVDSSAGTGMHAGMGMGSMSRGAGGNGPAQMRAQMRAQMLD